MCPDAGRRVLMEAAWVRVHRCRGELIATQVLPAKPVTILMIDYIEWGFNPVRAQAYSQSLALRKYLGVFSSQPGGVQAQVDFDS